MVPFPGAFKCLRAVGFGRWTGAVASWGLSLDTALQVSRLSFLKIRKGRRKGSELWLGCSVGSDVACGREQEVRWQSYSPHGYVLGGVTKLEEER